jgi:hypothetical protein
MFLGVPQAVEEHLGLRRRPKGKKTILETNVADPDLFGRILSGLLGPDPDSRLQNLGVEKYVEQVPVVHVFTENIEIHIYQLLSS